MTYAEAHRLWTETRKRKLGNNTYLVRIAGGYGIRLHSTIVVFFRPDYTVLNSGGWRTVTTKARMNEFSGFSVYQEKFVWYVEAHGKTWAFVDGLSLTPAA